MNLVMGVLCLWLGSALLWVATHGSSQGKDSGLSGPKSVLDSVLHEIGTVNS